MANTNFLQFDPQAMNMLDDENYLADAQRVSGVSTGLARSLLYNKQAFQASTMAVALANVMVANGKDAMDNNLTSLTENLLNTFVTTGQNNIFTGDNNIFTGDLYKELDAVLGTTPSEDKLTAFGVRDKNGATFGGWDHFYKSDGSTGKQITVRKQDGTDYALFTIGYDGSQNEFVSASAGVRGGIDNWGMPNYSSATSFNSGTNYEAPSNGFAAFIGSNSDHHTVLVKINGNTVLEYGNNAGYDRHTGIIPVKKGDIINISTSGSGSTITNTFYPCIGG